MSDSVKPEFIGIDHELADVINSVRRESDRSAALFAAAHLDELLKRLLLATMLQNSGTRNLFDGPNAPLGGLSSRSSAAYALGLITADEHRRLNILRRIRNELAHDARATFRNEKLVTRCFQFDPRGKVLETDGRNKSVMERGAAGRDKFNLHALALVITFTVRRHSDRLERLTVSASIGEDAP